MSLVLKVLGFFGLLIVAGLAYIQLMKALAYREDDEDELA